MKFIHSILGGTFDHFHAGHQRLISEALGNSQRLTIGITTEKMLARKLWKRSIESYEARENSIREFIDWNLRQCFCEAKNVFEDKKAVNIIPLQNIFGNALDEKEIDAIFVTADTLPGAIKINEARRDKGWPPLEIIEVSLVKDENGNKITSERIRGGDIDREGKVYLTLFDKDLQMPHGLRGELAKPWGKVILNLGGMRIIPPRLLTIAVGDIVSQKLLQAGIPADVNIIDGKTNRQKLKEMKIADFRFKNKAGTINSKTVKMINAILRKQKFPQSLFVEGEEDLLALPAILLAPLGSTVFYGLRDKGAVMVTVNEEIKEKVSLMLRKFYYE